MAADLGIRWGGALLGPRKPVRRRRSNSERQRYKVTEVHYALTRLSDGRTTEVEWLVWLVPAAGPKEERYLLRLVQSPRDTAPPYRTGTEVELDSRLLTRELPAEEGPARS